MMTDRQLDLIVTHRPGNPQVEITSYGVLHGEPPAPRHGNGLVAIDLTSALRNPHDDESMRQMTGLDEKVHDYVMATEGADEILDYAAAKIRAEYASRPNPKAPLEVHVYCRGGRHRSVAIALALRDALPGTGIVKVSLIHRDVYKPVIQPTPADQRADADQDAADAGPYVPGRDLVHELAERVLDSYGADVRLAQVEQLAQDEQWPEIEGLEDGQIEELLTEVRDEVVSRGDGRRR